MIFRPIISINSFTNLNNSIIKIQFENKKNTMEIIFC